MTYPAVKNPPTTFISHPREITASAQARPADCVSTEVLIRSFNNALFRQSAATLGIDTTDVADHQLIEVYLQRPSAALISPNPYFDELWYRSTNADVVDALAAGETYSGFIHFINFGISEGRWPNPILKSMTIETQLVPAAVYGLDADEYLNANPSARAFIRHFPMLTALQFFNLYGRFLGHRLANVAGQLAIKDVNPFVRIAADFDARFYREKYLTEGMAPSFLDDPFSHYLIYGSESGHSPNSSFDEAWYRAFYGEVRTAISRGEVVSGFYHFVAAGHAEGRLPKFDLKAALETRIPGVTRPSLMERIPQVRARLSLEKSVVATTTPPRVWFLFPTINPDITFGGYRSAFELLSAMYASGYSVGIMCTEDRQADKEYFLWRETSEALKNLIQQIPFINQTRDPHFEIGVEDTVVVYSVWDLYLADHLRKVAPKLRVVLLTQEYEPIFHDSSSIRAIVEEAYAIPHFPLINSAILCKYLIVHQIGVFGGKAAVRPDQDYAVFEHRINTLPSQTADIMKARKERVLVAYARPEGHAARNMFEILVLALQKICEEGLFGPEWSFIGLGALTDIEPIPLGADHWLQMRPKMTEEEYSKCISCMDIGVSLMFAPHPSVMPFEFATTGALVVTNTYENRSSEDLSKICRNIISGRPSVDGIASALRMALNLVPDVDRRIANIYRPKNTTWASIFNGKLLQTVFGSAPVEDLMDVHLDAAQ